MHLYSGIPLSPPEIEHYSMWDQTNFNTTWQVLSTCCLCHSGKWGMRNSCCIVRKAPGITKVAENNWSWTSKLSKSVLPTKRSRALRTGQKTALTQVLLQADAVFLSPFSETFIGNDKSCYTTFPFIFMILFLQFFLIALEGHKNTRLSGRKVQSSDVGNDARGWRFPPSVPAQL